MEIILLEKSRKGNIGDIIKVKDGYARNYLLRFGKALRLTEENKKIFEAKKSSIEAKNKEMLESAQKVLESLSGVSLDIEKQASNDDNLYGSVTIKDISSVLETSKGVKVGAEYIVVEKIRKLGVYPVEITLHPDVEIKMNINVIRAAE